MGLRKHGNLPARLEHAGIGSHRACAGRGGRRRADGLRRAARPGAHQAPAGGHRRWRAGAGPVRFAREPDVAIDTDLDSLVLTGEQSNTSLMFGEISILKVFRRPSPGPNPDLEVPRALARLGSQHVAEPLGWIETRMDGAPTVLGILSRYLRAASDGWSLAAASVRDLYAGEGTHRRGRRRRGPGRGGPPARRGHRRGAPGPRGGLRHRRTAAGGRRRPGPTDVRTGWRWPWPPSRNLAGTPT